MEEINAQLKELQHSMQILLRRHNNLLKENEQLKKINQELSSTLSEKENIVHSAQQRLTAEKIVSIYNVEEKKILHQKIEIYLRDIEKCLSLLNA